MKQNWEISELEKCLEKVTYTNKIQRKDFKDEGIYPIVSQEKEYINGYWDNENDLFLVEKPVVIFGDHTQVLKYVDFSFVLGADGVKILIPKKHIDSRYFYYYMQNVDLGSLGYARHYRLLKEIDVQYPSSLPEQQRIVSILDEAFAAIDKAKANAEQNLKNAKELFESYLQGVFEKKGDGWEEKTIKELTTILGDGLHGTPKYTAEGEYYFINGNNLNDGVIKFKENTKRVSVDEFKKYKKNLTDRTVLVSINGTLGNVAFYNDEKIILGKSACYFNLKDGVDKDFVKYVLSSPYFLRYAHKEATGATIKNVSLKTMREFVVPLPSLKTQQAIVHQLDALQAETQKMEAIYQKKIADLEELKKSVLQKAFAGELNLEAGTEPVEVAVPKTKK